MKKTKREIFSKRRNMQSIAEHNCFIAKFHKIVNICADCRSMREWTLRAKPTDDSLQKHMAGLCPPEWVIPNYCHSGSHSIFRMSEKHVDHFAPPRRNLICWNDTFMWKMFADKTFRLSNMAMADTQKEVVAVAEFHENTLTHSHTFPFTYLLIALGFHFEPGTEQIYVVLGIHFSTLICAPRLCRTLNNILFNAIPLCLNECDSSASWTKEATNQVRRCGWDVWSVWSEVNENNASALIRTIACRVIVVWGAIPFEIIISNGWRWAPKEPNRQTNPLSASKTFFHSLSSWNDPFSAANPPTKPKFTWNWSQRCNNENNISNFANYLKNIIERKLIKILFLVFSFHFFFNSLPFSFPFHFGRFPFSDSSLSIILLILIIPFVWKLFFSKYQ